MSALFLHSCGEAGVQVKVGDDYSSDFQVTNLLLIGLASGTESTDINQELLDFGSFIENVEVKSLRLEFEGVDNPFTASIDLNLSGQAISLPNIEVLNSNSYEITNINLSAIENIIQTGEVNVGYDISSSDPNALNLFTMSLIFEVFANVQAD